MVAATSNPFGRGIDLRGPCPFSFVVTIVGDPLNHSLDLSGLHPSFLMVVIVSNLLGCDHHLDCHLPCPLYLL